MIAAVNPCEFVKCRNVKLSEESLRRHYDVLLEIVKDDFGFRHHWRTALETMRKTRNLEDLKHLEPYRWRSISDIYEAVGISSKIGDKILDRLECCWKYIACKRGVGNRRKYCTPTLLGRIAILSKPEYFNKLKEYLPTLCRDPSDRECTLRVHDQLMLYGMVSSLILSFFKSIDNLRALINDARTTLLNNEIIRNAITEYFYSGFLDDEEIRSDIAARLGLPRTAPASVIMNKLLDSLMNDVVACAKLDAVIFECIHEFLWIVIGIIINERLFK